MEHLTSEQQAAMAQKMQRGSLAYVRNLAAAEQAVRRGQFNVEGAQLTHCQRVRASRSG